MLTKNRKVEIINKFGKNDSDTGSTEVQVALLTERINSLTEHLRNQPKDYSSRRGLLRLVGQRRNFMNYLKKRDIDMYGSISEKLQIRVKCVKKTAQETCPRGLVFCMVFIGQFHLYRFYSPVSGKHEVCFPSFCYSILVK